MGIQMGTILVVADNFGPSLVRCIGILNKTGQCTNGKVGDILTVSVISKKSGCSADIKKGDVHRALVVGTRQNVLRVDGSVYRVIDGTGKVKSRKKNRHRKVICNRVVLINKNGQPLGTRIFGPIPREIRKKSGFNSIISMAAEVL